MKEIKIPKEKKEGIEKILKDISMEVDKHNKMVDKTTTELKYKICFNWLAVFFILIGIIQFILLLYIEAIGWAIAIAVFIVPIAYDITKKRYCEPYYETKQGKASDLYWNVQHLEGKLSELMRYKVFLFQKDFQWDDYVFIEGGGMHQDDYYAELYGGRWTSFAIEINGKNFSFNPYEDITYI
jgi:hypothetical protein